MIENGADLDAKTINGYTPLHITARHGHLEIVKYLIEIGVDFMAINNEEKTPLDLAIELNKTDVVAFLETYINNMKYHA